MSEHEFHVHGPHDHEVEHVVEHGAADPFSGRMALTTALLATVGALFSFQGGDTQANAQLYKNDAAIKKTEAADKWNFYQAKSNKQNLAELGAMLAPADRQDRFKADMERYSKEKAEIKVEAEKLAAESQAWDDRSEEQMHLHHRWAQATTLLQISIAMAAVALLTRKKWLQWAVYGFSAFGIAVGALAVFHV